MKTLPFSCCLAALVMPAHAASLVVEAEQFSAKGGWGTDTEFIESMGSPYLIAHGLGVPVADAETSVNIPEAGHYRVWVRTIDWSKRLGREGGAGRFQVVVDGKPLPVELGKGNADWSWQSAGEADLKAGNAKLALHDLTGFDGRADAVILSSDPSFTPPDKCAIADRTAWALPGTLTTEDHSDTYDLVVIGGGYGGLGSAIAAARMGCKVALIQNRSVLGGNGSSEVRVWANGTMPANEYKLADIIQEVTDHAKDCPAPAEAFEDAKKERIVRAEPNITLLLDHHAYGLEMQGPAIAAVKVLDIPHGKVSKIRGKLFADCTGHGFIGEWADADRQMLAKGRMGMSNMWSWENTAGPQSFPEQPWMLPFTQKSFPYPQRNHAEWFWESGFDDHPINDLEATRDWNLAASYSAWNAIKNHGAYAARDPQGHANARLTWLAFIGGPRETQQLLGDVILSDKDVDDKTPFPDGCVLTTWSIDLHYPNTTYKDLPNHPFISKAVFRASVDRKIGYPIPYRSFYSRNVPNLFMAGRNISVTHEALGTVRVMNTIGMMGVAVGRAAAVCKAYDCLPRDVYEKHLEAAKALWRMPGTQRFQDGSELRKAAEAPPQS